MIKRILSMTLLIAGLFSLAAESNMTIVVSTSWTAAFAEAAGATDVTVLAPYDMLHPSEYELSAKDIRKLTEADLFIYAGYEGMMNQIREDLEIPADKLLQIETVNTPAVIRKSVSAIAERLGTEEMAEENLRAIEQVFTSWRMDLDLPPVIVHFFQQGIVKSLGIQTAGIFGPAPMEPGQLLTLKKSGSLLIIDNWHNPVGAPLEESIPGAKWVEFINFPGKDGTRTLLDVIQYNRRMMETF